MNNIFQDAMLVLIGLCVGSAITGGVYTKMILTRHINDYNVLLAEHQRLQGQYTELQTRQSTTKVAQVPLKSIQPMMTYITGDGRDQGNYERFGSPFEQ